jgi:TatD DNase family protein
VIDIGVNLLHPQFDADRAAVLVRAAAAGVHGLLITGTDLASSRAAADYCATASGHAGALSLWCTAGIHPHHAAEAVPGWQEILRALAADPAVRAIGETGLDFYRNFSPAAAQQQVFAAQLDIAAELGLPVFVHDRDSDGAVLAELEPRAGALTDVVVHCFTGDREILERYLGAGFHIGITGWVCDPSRGRELRDAVPLIPLERLLVETDAPFLRPQNAPPAASRALKRRNEPALLQHVVDTLAELLATTPAEVARHSERNARRVFRLGEAV